MDSGADSTRTGAGCLRPGLVSVTFRRLSPREVVELALRARLELIEWGGDIHVPPGEVAHAHEVGARTRDAGLAVAAYGSYYRVGAAVAPPFAAVLKSAVALGAPLIRVWAGARGADDAEPEDWERVIADTRRICDQAADAGLEIAYEFHGGTLTDTVEGAVRLLESADRSNLRTLWQPRTGTDTETRLAEIRALRPWLANVHVFHWPHGKRAPLSDGAAQWRALLDLLAEIPLPPSLLLEFVRDDAPEQLLEDAATLHAWLTTREAWLTGARSNSRLELEVEEGRNISGHDADDSQ